MVFHKQNLGRFYATDFGLGVIYPYLPAPSGSGSPAANGAVEATMRTKREGWGGGKR